MSSSETAFPIGPGAGGSRELLKLAAPLVLSSSFFTLQLTIDRLMLSNQDSDSIGAAMSAGVLYWAPLALLQFTASYAGTFVAQYAGAGRKDRIGPAVWQSLYFAVIAGFAFLLFIPFLEPLVAFVGHEPKLRQLEVDYLFCMCFATLPFLLVASINAFFSGRGDTWRVLITDVSGALTAVLLCYVLIYGHWGFPAMGIRGAGWATVIGNWVAVAVGLTMMMQRKFRDEFQTLSGWRFDPALFKRLMRFGLPNGMQYGLEALAFAIFLVLVGRIGKTELSATSIAFTINMLAIVPMLGLAQAVSVLVGQRLGQNRPDIAQRSAVRGVGWGLLYTLGAAVIFVALPRFIAHQFRDDDMEQWSRVEPLIPMLMKFVAVYCLFESVSLILSAALRGAGDTRFVSLMTLIFSWTILVGPTILARHQNDLRLVWVFATTYLLVLSGVFTWRFYQGKWRSMRVIETPTAPLAM